uniref:Ig-like domain-containing protein n=1 Tax=Neogobius melanostomus TaxID=47308 RepID=A0A8C6SIJ1_9GOBI
MELLTLILLTLWTLWTTTGEERSPSVSSHVSCVFMETCLLPCSFKPGDLVIAWSKGRMTVHIFDQGKDELKDQDASFRGRTSLFPEQFFVGNTSMQLFKVTVDDEGIYHCFVHDRKTFQQTHKDIHLRVESPVKALSMEWKGDVLVCSSEGIYPQPNVRWAPPLGTKPRSNQ